MINTIKGILKNTAVIYAIEICNKVFFFVFIIYSARTLGVKLFGDLSYGLTIYLLLQVLSDFGLGSFLTKEIAQNPARKNEIFRTALNLRILVTFFIFLFFIFYLNLVKDSLDVQLFVLVSGMSLLLSSYAQNFMLTLRGMNLIYLEGLIRMLSAFITAVFGLAALRAGFGIIGIAFAISLGNMSTIVSSAWVNKKHIVITMAHVKTKRSDHVDMLKKTLPFLTMVILSTMFSKADTLILQHLKNSTEVGLYHASTKVIEGLLIFQGAFAMVLLPILSRHIAMNDEETVRKISQLALKYMGFIGIFFAVVTVFMADKIIEVLYFSHDYDSAIFGLQVFALVTLVLYLTTPIGYLLLASNIPHAIAIIQLLMVFLSISMNFLLIPKFGFAGAASVRLAIEIFGMLLSLLVINKYLFPLNILSDMKIPILAGIAVAATIFLVKSLLFLPFYFIVYVTVLYLLGGISERESAFIKELVSERFKKT